MFYMDDNLWSDVIAPKHITLEPISRPGFWPRIGGETRTLGDEAEVLALEVRWNILSN